ncbi:UPF0764 protein C16orf89 homolog [Pristis pectinata]|uniref:UPF0764 protein C16orf89 homolog n=1 Tax=Pristis pectinata TaxID=685728 RepID=UPI00223E29CE|nr:UPF0764 protein C16orf89 homolog [Pristis pectinata]
MNSVLIIITVLSCVSANERKVNHIISTLERAVLFFEVNYDRFNLDGVTGYRVLQALLEDTLKRWTLSGPEADSPYTKVEDLVKKVGFTVEMAIKELKLHQPAYFNAFEPILQVNFWTFRPEWTQTDRKLVYPKWRVKECFEEEDSDICMFQILGTWKDYRVNCLDTAKCTKLMTTLYCSDYSLSHQLIYFILAEIKNCTNIVGSQHPQSRNSISTQRLKKIFCTNMMEINLHIEKDGFPVYQRDLFLENIMLCGMIGYSDFYKTRWLEAILSWQYPSGCYVETGRSMHSAEMKQNAFTEHKRVKREDVLLDDNCSCHKTAVAVGALGSYLRFYGISQNVIEP